MLGRLASRRAAAAAAATAMHAQAATAMHAQAATAMHAQAATAARSARPALTATTTSATCYAVRQPAAAATAAVRAMSTTTTDDEAPTDVWEAVRVMRAPEASTEQRIDAITAIKIDAESLLEKQQQALKIVESDALVALLEFLQDADSTEASALLVPAFLALIRLSSQPLVAQELVRLDALPLLAHFLTLPDPRLQAAASLTLGIVALEPAAGAVVSDANVLANVLALLESPHEAIQRAGATCLANIAGHGAAREQLLRETDALATLTDLLSSEHSDAMRSAAAFALGNLLSGRDIGAQDAVRENGGLAELVLLLSPAFAEEVNTSAAWAIHHGVYLNHASQSLVAEAGGLHLLVQHLSAATAQLQTNALLALASTVEAHVQNKAWCRVHDVAATLEQVEADDGDDMDASAKRALQQIVTDLAS